VTQDHKIGQQQGEPDRHRKEADGDVEEPEGVVPFWEGEGREVGRGRGKV
jgi:hypothetical protein